MKKFLAIGALVLGATAAQAQDQTALRAVLSANPNICGGAANIQNVQYAGVNAEGLRQIRVSCAPSATGFTTNPGILAAGAAAVAAAIYVASNTGT